MSTGIAGERVRGSTRYPVPIVTAWSRILWVTGTVLLVTMLVHIAALMVAGGPWTGPVSLRKPATFAETGWLTCWSVALILPVVRTQAWQRHLVGTATVLFGIGETAKIGFQAWRGVPSHDNFTTPPDAALMRGGARLPRPEPGHGRARLPADQAGDQRR